MVTDTSVRDLLVGSVRKYAANGLNNEPFSDWYDTITGRVQGFRARPVAGGHLALVLVLLWSHHSLSDAMLRSSLCNQRLRVPQTTTTTILVPQPQLHRPPKGVRSSRIKELFCSRLSPPCFCVPFWFDLIDGPPVTHCTTMCCNYPYFLPNTCTSATARRPVASQLRGPRGQSRSHDHRC